MTRVSDTPLNLDHTYDTRRARHRVNNFTSVLHCHHYTTLFTQLALDCEFLNGRKLLADSMEETIITILKDYFKENNITRLDEKIETGEEFYRFFGMGRMEVECLGDFSGKVILHNSHLDQGWISKWGKSSEPVNYISAGFIAAVFCAVLDKPKGSFIVKEAESIACGAEKSVFTIIKA